MSSLNWYAGWCLILTGFVTGAVIGLFFHADNFADGYSSWRRRLMRLGHIALVALGMLNLIFALGPVNSAWASRLFVVGGIAMPTVCFLSAWRKPCRHLFFVPVVALVAAVLLTITATNPNVEAESARPAKQSRNPKEAEISKQQTSGTGRGFASLPTFLIPSNFDIRISNFPGGVR